MTHEERVRIAREVAARIVERYGNDVLAVFITSSTAKGLDREHSDLEISVVVRDGVEIEEKSYVYHGVLVEIDYPQASRLLEEARRLDGRWPVKADVHRSRIVLFERDRWLDNLRSAVAENDAADPARALQHAATMLIESLGKLRNARLEGDPLEVLVEAYWTAEAAANLVLLLNRRYMITTRLFFRQAFECPEQPPEFRPRMERLLGLTAAGEGEVAAIADALTADLLAMVAARGVQVESETLIV